MYWSAWPHVAVSGAQENCLSEIARAAGQADGMSVVFVRPDLFVKGVTQAALETAAAQSYSPPPGITYKSDVWRRMTDAEAETLAGLLASAPARQRELFASIAYIDPSDADYPMLRDPVVAALGEERAAVVLAPSI